MSAKWSTLLRPHGLVLAVAVLIALATLILMKLILIGGEERAERELGSKMTLTATTLNHSIETSYRRIWQRLESFSQVLSADPTVLESDGRVRSLLQERVALVDGFNELAFYDRTGQLEVRTAQDSAAIPPEPDCLPSVQAVTSGVDRAIPGYPHAGRFLHAEPSQGASRFHIPFCIGVRNAQGVAMGTLVAAVDAGYFATEFESVQNLMDVQVALYRPDGVLLASGSQAHLLSSLPTMMLPFTDDPDQQNGRTGSRHEGLIYSYRMVTGLPLVTVAEQSVEYGLQAWRDEARVIKALFLSLTGMILVGGLSMYFSLRRQARMESDIQLLSTAISTTANSIFITDIKGRIRWVNNAFERLTGWSKEEVLGQTPKLFNSGHHDPLFFHDLWQTLMAGEVWRGQVRNRNRKGESLLVEQTITPIANKRGQLTHFVAIHEDVTERARAEQQARYLARHDQLTGLPNRRFLGETLVTTLADNRQAALVFIDLDRFKTINDTRGHDVGDQMLRAVSERLESMAGKTATVARLGGDEFAVLLPGMSAERLQVRLDSVLQALAEPYQIDGESYSLTVSVGVAVAENGDTDAATLLRQADLAMFRAKQEGRNTFSFFDADMDRSLHRHAQLEQGLREALASGDQLSLRYQPILDAQSLEPIAVEVLTRWQDSQGEWISPAEFIPVAEESDLILEIGRWQLEQLFALMQAWRGTPMEDLRVSINLSAVQLTRDTIAEYLLDTMQRFQIPAHKLSVEITETAVMASREQAEHNLQLIHEAGIQLSIDDFGTGYSSLAYISELDASTLKIDRSFIVGIGKSRNDEEIIETMLELASNLGITVVAEGVDDSVQLEFLRRAGCDLVQGFMFAKPLTEAQLLQYLQQPVLLEND